MKEDYTNGNKGNIMSDVEIQELFTGALRKLNINEKVLYGMTYTDAFKFIVAKQFEQLQEKDAKIQELRRQCLILLTSDSGVTVSEPPAKQRK